MDDVRAAIPSQMANCEVDNPMKVRSLRERHTLLLIYATVFLYLYAENVQPAARTQIYENIICRRNLGTYISSASSSVADACKDSATQKELAFLRGMERLTGALPTILAIPYSLLAERVGRSFTLTLALVGLLCEESWSLVIAWSSDVAPLRLILFGPTFEVIGGGPAIITTMLHILAADLASPETRVNTFFTIRATGIVAAMIAQVTGSLMMDLTPWLPWLTGLASLSISAAVAYRIPDALSEQSRDAPSSVDIETTSDLSLASTKRASDPSIMPRRLGFAAASAVISRLGIVFANPRLMLLLAITFCSQLSEDSVPMILLLYISKRFGWTFAKANLLWALGEGVQFLFLILLLPRLNKTLSTHYALEASIRDIYITIASLAMLTIGTLLLGLSPFVAAAAIGIVLLSTAGGVQSLLRSLVTEMISSKDISVVYSIFTVLHVLSSSLAGPVYSGTFTAVLGLGTRWTGLPFIVAGALALASLCMTLSLRPTHAYKRIDAMDSENVL